MSINLASVEGDFLKDEGLFQKVLHLFAVFCTTKSIKKSPVLKGFDECLYKAFLRGYAAGDAPGFLCFKVSHMLSVLFAMKQNLR